MTFPRRAGPVAAGLLLLWGLRLVWLHRSISRYAEYWSALRSEPGRLLYVALGDSATQGIGASTTTRGYTAPLADRLRASTDGPVQVINLSRSGATFKDVRTEQLPRLAALQPDVVTVAVGGNDMLHVATGAFHDDDA